jgi:heptosyltransferase-2
VSPGSKWGTKRWLAEKYSALIDELIANDDNAVIVLGSPDEKELNESVVEKCKTGRNDRLLNLTGQTQLDELRALYPQLSALVTNDSSPLHYASAFDIPTVAIFGATLPEMGFGPVAEKSVVVEKKGLPCRPCSDHGPEVCPLSHFKCMKEISVKEVLQAIESTY